MNLSRFAFLTLATLALPVFAQNLTSNDKIDSKKISKLVDQVDEVLTGLVSGVSQKTVQGDSAEEMLLNRAANEEETAVINYPEDKDMPTGENTGSQVGLLRLKDAVDLALANPFEYGEPTAIQLKVTTAKLTRLFVELKKAGALLGYTNYGSSVCGAWFPSVLILDKKSGIIYEIIEVGGEC